MNGELLYTGDIVIVKDVTTLRTILRADPDSLASIIAISDLERLAHQPGTIIDVRVQNETVGDVALIALNNGLKINLPTAAVEVIDPTALIDDQATSPSEILRQRPMMRRNDSYVTHDLDGEQLLVQNMAASSIQNVVRRYMECKEHMKIRRINSQQHLVENLAAKTITGGMRRILLSKTNSNRSIPIHTEIQQQHVPGGSVADTLELESVNAPQDAATFQATHSDEGIGWVLRLVGITLNNVPNVAWKRKNDLFCTIEVSNDRNWSERTSTIEHAGESGVWEDVEINVPIFQNDIWKSGHLIVRVYHQTIAAADKYIGETTIALRSISSVQEFDSFMENTDRAVDAVHNFEIDDLSLQITDGNKIKPRPRGAINLKVTVVRCEPSAAAIKPNRRPSVTLKDSTLSFLERSEKKRNTQNDDTMVDEQQHVDSAFTTNQLQNARDILDDSESRVGNCGHNNNQIMSLPQKENVTAATTTPRRAFGSSRGTTRISQHRTAGAATGAPNDSVSGTYPSSRPGFIRKDSISTKASNRTTTTPSVSMDRSYGYRDPRSISNVSKRGRDIKNLNNKTATDHQYDPFRVRGKHVIDEAYRLALKKECAQVRMTLRELLSILRATDFAVKEESYFSNLEANANANSNQEANINSTAPVDLTLASFADGDSLTAYSDNERNQPEVTPRSGMLHRIHSIGSSNGPSLLNNVAGGQLLDQFVDLPLLHSVSLAATVSFLIRDYNLLEVEAKYSTVITEAHTQRLLRYVFNQIEGKYRDVRTVTLFACEGHTTERAQDTLHAVKGIVMEKNSAASALGSIESTDRAGRGKPSCWSSRWVHRFLKALKVLPQDVDIAEENGANESSLPLSGVDLLEFTEKSIRTDAPSHPLLRTLLLGTDTSVNAASLSNHPPRYDVCARFRIWQQTLRYLEFWWGKGLRPEDPYATKDTNKIASTSLGNTVASTKPVDSVHDKTEDTSWGNLSFSKVASRTLYSTSITRHLPDYVRADCFVEIAGFQKLLTAQIAFNRGYGWGCSVDGITFFASNVAGSNGYLVKNIDIFSSSLGADDEIRSDMMKAPLHVPFKDAMCEAEIRDRQKHCAGEWVLLAEPSKHTRTELQKLSQRWSDSRTYCRCSIGNTKYCIAFFPISCLRVAVPHSEEEKLNAGSGSVLSALNGTAGILSIEDEEDDFLSELKVGTYVYITQRAPLQRICERFEWWDCPPADVLQKMAGQKGEVVSIAELQSKRRVGIQIIGKKYLCDALPVEALRICSEAEVRDLMHAISLDEAIAAAKSASIELGLSSSSAAAEDAEEVRQIFEEKRKKSSSRRKSTSIKSSTFGGKNRRTSKMSSSKRQSVLLATAPSSDANELMKEKNRLKGRKHSGNKKSTSATEEWMPEEKLDDNNYEQEDEDKLELLSPPTVSAPILSPKKSSTSLGIPEVDTNQNIVSPAARDDSVFDKDNEPQPTPADIHFEIDDDGSGEGSSRMRKVTVPTVTMNKTANLKRRSRSLSARAKKEFIQEDLDNTAKYAWMRPPQRSPLRVGLQSEVPEDPAVLDAPNAPSTHYAPIRPVQAVFDVEHAEYTDGVIYYGHEDKTTGVETPGRKRPQSAPLGGKRVSAASTQQLATPNDKTTRFGLAGIGYTAGTGQQGTEAHAGNWFNEDIPADQDEAGGNFSPNRPNNQHFRRSGAITQRKDTRKLFHYSERKPRKHDDDAVVEKGTEDQFGIAGTGTSKSSNAPRVADDGIDWSVGGHVRTTERSKSASAVTRPSPEYTAADMNDTNSNGDNHPYRTIPTTTVTFDGSQENDTTQRTEHRPASAGATKRRSSAGMPSKQRTSLAGYMRGVDVILEKDDALNHQHLSNDPQYASREKQLYRQATARSQKESHRKEDILQRELKHYKSSS